MSEVTTAPVVEVARAFFDACETGKGWEVCQQFCTANASFAAQPSLSTTFTRWSNTQTG